MDKFFCLLLLLLGLLAAEDLIRSKFPKIARFYLTLNQYAEYLGIAGLVIGFIWFVRAVALLVHYGSLPLIWLLLIWVLDALMIALGLLFGMRMLRMIIGEPAPVFILKAEKLRAMLVPQRQQIGLGATVLGIVFLLS